MGRGDDGDAKGVLWVIGAALRVLLKVVAWLVVVCVPLLGVWAASSLAVYWDGPVWAAILAGLAAFPLAPLAWEGLSAWRRARKESPRKRILTFGDRMVARSFSVSFVFLAGFLALYPTPVFEALATRGDWMLQGRDDPTSEAIRGGLFRTADAMSWLYEWANEDEYADDAETETPTPDPPPPPTPAPSPTPPPSPTPTPEPDAPGAPSLPTEPHARIAATRGDAPPPWPLPNVPHPVALAVPAEHEGSLTAVAQYIAAQEPDPYLRVKALHDYVARRVAYDAPNYVAGDYPPQDAETVFQSRTGVCAGYANLMVAMGEAVGENIVYVSGHARDEDDAISGEGHAWNAVEIEGRWYLMDATWDAGTVDGATYTARYKSDYLMTPPEVFGLDHFPREEGWQLRAEPIGRAEFVRQPRLSPAFYRVGLRLMSPERSHVSVDDVFHARVENPRGRFLLARMRSHGAPSDGPRCDVSNGPLIDVRCDLPRGGRWDVTLYESGEQYATYWSVGSFQVVANR